MSASSVCTQYWRNWYGLVRSADEPHRVAGRLAELLPVAAQQQRPRQPVGGAAGRPADQVDPGGDVAPLIGAAHLQLDAVLVVEMPEVVGLQAACS